MIIEGKDTIAAPRAEVWRFFVDAESVAQCTPGLESMEVIEPDKKFKAVGAMGLGTVKVKFTTTIEWLELNEPESARMKMHGSAPGSSIDVHSEIHLAEVSDDETELSWKADVNVVGTIASLASRLMKPVTGKMTTQFFDCAKKKIER